MKRTTRMITTTVMIITGMTMATQAGAHDRAHMRDRDYSYPTHMIPGPPPGSMTPGGMPGYMMNPGHPGRWGNAHYDDMSGRDYGMDRLDMMSRRLDLSRDQRKAVADILRTTRRELRDLAEDLHDNRRALARAMRDGQGNTDEFNSLAQKQGQLVTQLIKKRGKRVQDILQILDEDQRDRMGDDIEYWLR